MDTAGGGIAIQVTAIGMTIVFLLSVFVVLFFIIYQRRLFAQQKAHQEKEANYQKELLTAAISSQELERNRIGRELHDDIGAMLTTTKIYASQISSDLTADDLHEVTDKMNALFDDMIQNTRRISQDLRPVVLEKLGLVEGLQSLIQTLNESGNIQIDFSAEGPDKGDKTVELNLYRIVQEMITNTLKHANATLVTINLKEHADQIILNYQDNGVGMDENINARKRGIGLKNIESRVSILSGSLELMTNNKEDTLEGNGTHFRIEIPLNNKTV